jgi:hypothetical protein
MRRPRWYMNHRSLRASPSGSTAVWCHCTHRLVLVKEPDFSVWEAAGKKNTSVPMSSVRSSPLSISGPSFHQVADAMSEKSRTTSHSRLAMPSRCRRVFAEPTAGFSPIRK